MLPQIAREYPNIHPEDHYKRSGMSSIFSGTQILNLLQFVRENNLKNLEKHILLSIQKTNLPINTPDTKYGV